MIQFKIKYLFSIAQNYYITTYSDCEFCLQQEPQNVPQMVRYSLYIAWLIPASRQIEWKMGSFVVCRQELSVAVDISILRIVSGVISSSTATSQR